MPAPSKHQVQAQQDRTLKRLDQVKHHFDSTPAQNRFNAKVGIITGVGSVKGIGRATARLLAREGAKALYVLDYDGSTLDEFARELQSKHSGLSVTSITADASDTSVISSLCARALKEQGRLDFFFANAGTTGANMSLEGLDEEGVMQVMKVNVLSCFVAVKHASAAMKQNPPEARGGSIVLTASVAGLRSGAGPQDYSASKAAVINLANTSAQILAGTDIRVVRPPSPPSLPSLLLPTDASEGQNAICPGLIETGMTTWTFDQEAIALYQLGLFSTTVAEAANHLKSAAILFAECGDEGREAMCYAELGNLFAAGEGGDPDSGLWFFKQALLLYLKLGDTVKEAHCLFSCGVLFARLPPPDHSLPSSITSSPSLSVSTSCTTSHYTPNPTQSALAYLSQSATLFRKLKDRKGEAECRYQMGKVFARIGGAREKSGLERAVKEFEEASNLFLKAGSTTDCAWTYYRLSLVMLKVHSKELALDYLAEARKLFADAKEKKAEGACLVRMAEVMRGEVSAEASVPGSKEEDEAVVADKYLEEAATLMPSSTFDRLTRSHSRSSAHVGRRGTIRLSASSPQLSSPSTSQLRRPPRLRTASSPEDTSHALEIVREEDEENEQDDDQAGKSLARRGSEGGLGFGGERGGEAWWAVKDEAG
ncbi:hypothetical protein Rt10032_c10g4091 [Rhodotorula toruloides]|uniref:Uncharacterized protein n=1 Tax=Rhodotorula toruloides TaxID=5286 RepID=A0A511KKU6_RHOTO|nr:hypothetical protein Rt10032_c10g4091 [Rhodotorula toruloides]